MRGLGTAKRIWKRLARLVPKPRVPRGAALPYDVVHAPGDGPNVLILTEFVNASYYIFFDIPLRDLAARGLGGVAVLEQKKVESLGKSLGLPALVDRLVSETAPRAVVLCRYSSQDGPMLTELFRRRGVPTVYHIDDDLLEPEARLGAGVVGAHGRSETVQARREMLLAVDLIYASTEPLARRLAEQVPGRPIVYGYTPPYVEQPPPAEDAARDGQVTVGYAGSRGHQADLDMLAPAVARVMDRHPHVRFEVFGTIALPEPLARFGDRTAHRGLLRDYREYLTQLARLRWDVGLIPLADTTFNLCRTCTKYVEYTAGNIVSIASDMPVYNAVVNGENGLLAGEHDWESCLERLVCDPALRSRVLENARATCRAEFAPENLEKRILGVISRAAKGRLESEDIGLTEILGPPARPGRKAA